MADLSVKYMGLSLKSPVIAGSSGLTNTLDDLKKIEAAGAGAVVLKSIFEEQIQIESELNRQSDKGQQGAWNAAFTQIVSEDPFAYEEALEYISGYARENTLEKYLNFVSDAKKALSIPVIASINCASPFNWADFAKRIQQAGADAIELNVYLLPSDFDKTSADIEKIYTDIAAQVKKAVSIPVALKIGSYFSSLAYSVKKIAENVDGLVLFNRPFTPDINIENISLTKTSLLSNENEYLTSLRWTGILSGKVHCDLVASTGIHSYETVVKQLLAGATAVQVASVLFEKGIDVIKELNLGLSKWISKQGFTSIEQFRGKLSQANVENPAAYERVQFMKNYAGI